MYAHQAHIIVAAWLDAVLAVAPDASIQADLGTLACVLCQAQPPLAEMFAEALVVSCWGISQAKSKSAGKT